MMKTLKNNCNRPNDVGVICNGKKQTRWIEASGTIKGVEMN
jgi:hypothetical protein